MSAINTPAFFRPKTFKIPSGHAGSLINPFTEIFWRVKGFGEPVQSIPGMLQLSVALWTLCLLGAWFNPIQARRSALKMVNFFVDFTVILTFQF